MSKSCCYLKVFTLWLFNKGCKCSFKNRELLFYRNKVVWACSLFALLLLRSFWCISFTIWSSAVFWSTDLITTLPSCCNTSFKLARSIRCHVKLKPWVFRWWWVSLFSSPDRLAKHRYYQEKLTHLSLLEVKLKYWNGRQDILEFIFIN